MNAEEGAREFRRRVDALRFGLRQAVEEQGKETLARAIELSSGTLSPADLSRMDHPYARRHGTAQQRPELVNVLTGAFRAGWQPGTVEESDTGISVHIWNDDPKGEDYLKPGTRFMVPRPIEETLQREADLGLMEKTAQVRREFEG